MEGLGRWIPDVEYRIFMLNLSRQVTAQDMEELKYMLASPVIPDGRMDTFNTALKLFYHLKNLRFVGPDNLGNLKELFLRMDKPTLYAMTMNFTHERDSRTVETLPEFVVSTL